MPELPEVETVKRGISPFVTGATLDRVVVRQPSLRWPVPSTRLKALEGQSINSITRRGKYLLLTFPSNTVLLHLGMSGSIRVLDPDTVPGKHDHIDLLIRRPRTRPRVVRFHDPRRFGCCLVTDNKPEQHPLLAELGPEPLSDDFSGDSLHEASRNRRVTVKSLIMDGRVVVGVGNIYASEALFLAGIRPGIAAGRISRPRYHALGDAIKMVLQKAINAGGTTLSDFTRSDGQPGYFSQQLQVYGRQGEPCFQCETAIQSRIIAQRNTYYCQHCQS